MFSKENNKIDFTSTSLRLINDVKLLIESLGGKVVDSISSKTNYLINNDIESGSSKNKKAKELGIPIITEDMYIEMFKSGDGEDA